MFSSVPLSQNGKGVSPKNRESLLSVRGVTTKRLRGFQPAALDRRLLTEVQLFQHSYEPGLGVEPGETSAD
jgi:hypothetical protein